MTQPDDTRIRLLTAMGRTVKGMCPSCCIDQDQFPDTHSSFCNEWPAMDANLLSAAREQLLTTEEERAHYFAHLSQALGLDADKCLLLTRAEITWMLIVATPLEQSRAILAVKEAQ